MISGRGLGHTGGTLDKLDSIPGYVSQPDIETFRRVTREVGCAIIGQTADLAPADKRLYAIRDVTATVESIDLITASILSKKLAAGLDGLVMDVKFGSGAFMDNADDARKLAESLVLVANGAGLPTSCASHRHGRTARLRRRQRGRDGLCRGLPHRAPSREALPRGDGGAFRRDAACSASSPPTIEEARAKIEHAISSGKAAEVFQRMVAALGGPADFVANV